MYERRADRRRGVRGRMKRANGSGGQSMDGLIWAHIMNTRCPVRVRDRVRSAHVPTPGRDLP